jgi:hypothetical protein
MYPEDVKRKRDHPAPFPQKLAGRLIRLYTYGAVGDFPGEIVLDPFAGAGTTCAVAKSMDRRYIGIDINARYITLAGERVRNAPESEPLLMVGRAKYPGKEELQQMLETEAGTAGRLAEAKHKRRTYGRKLQDKVQDKNGDQFRLV